jgi:outer membrane receptor protein involved in Fe transport
VILGDQRARRLADLDGLRIGAGVENVTDEDPPAFPSYIAANTDPSQYDVFGRRYYAGLRYSF